MASPIRWFRKHSQFFIVIFGVLLMGIFGLGSVISSFNPASMGSRNRAENPVVAEWSGGELKKSDLFVLRQRHFASLRFLERVKKYAVEQNDGNPFPIAVDQIRRIDLPERPGESVGVLDMDSRLMNRYLFAKRAEQEGFVVDDKMVYEYIAQYGGDVELNKNILKQLNRQVNQNVHLTSIVRHIQIELLWQQMNMMARGGLPFDLRVGSNAISPTEAMELYVRTNRRIECKILPVSVEQYVSKITEEPSEEELRNLYEEGKYEYPNPNFEKPGFKQLKKVRVQYFVGELETFLQNEMAKLTDEEVQQEYDKLVEAEDNLVMEVVPIENSIETQPEDGADDAVESEADVDNADDPAPAPGIDDVELPAKGTADQDTPAKESQDSDEQDDTVIPDETDDTDHNETDENGDSYTSVGFQDDAVQENSDDTGQGEPNGDGQNQSEGDASEKSPQKADSSTTESGGDAAAADGQADSSDPAGNADSKKEGESQQKVKVDDGDDPVMEEKPETQRRAKPLKDVADQIKRRMKMQVARAARDKAMDAAEKEIRKYEMNASKWEYEKENSEKGAKAPTPPDCQAIADKFAIQFNETELIDDRKIGDQQIGKVVKFEIANGQVTQINIGQQIFQEYERTPVYQPATVNDFRTNSSYLYWLAEKVDHKVPNFEEAHDSIVDFWKFEKGVELAKQEAQRIADDVNSAEKLLSDIYPEKSVDTGAFTWFSTFGRFAYGIPEGVTNAGEDFMSTAFQLENKVAGVTMNETRDTVYVVQPVTLYEMTTDQIGTEYLEKNFFLTKQIPSEVISAKMEYRRKMNSDWIEEFRETMDVKIVGQ